VGLAVVLTTLCFTHLTVHSVLVSIAALVLAALVSALAGFITAMLAKGFEHVTTIQILIVTPLTYFGGVFSSISTLPGWAQKLSHVNPMFYMVNAFRHGFLGISDEPVGTAFCVVTAFGAGLFLAAVTLLGRGAGIREA